MPVPTIIPTPAVQNPAMVSPRPVWAPADFLILLSATMPQMSAGMAVSGPKQKLEMPSTRLAMARPEVLTVGTGGDWLFMVVISSGVWWG